MRKLTFIMIALFAALVSFVSCNQDSGVIPVTSVTLNHFALSLNIGESETLTAKVHPDNATDKTVIWKSSDESIATVSNGTVTGIKAGQVKITATAGERTATCHILVVDPEKKKVPLTLHFTKGGTLEYTNSDPYFYDTLYYSKNGGDIVELPTSIAVEAGDTIRLYADRDKVSFSRYLTIKCIECECYIYGNVMSLIKKDGFENLLTIPFANAFTSLFYNNQGIALHPTEPLVLPAVVLKSECYKNMFARCERIEASPDLPARFLAPNCYESMFEGCKNLKKAPVLPAKVLISYCYKQMFSGCTSLKEAPALEATVLAKNCYDNMFNGCTALEVAPALPAPKLAANCYQGMFSECASLTTAPALPVKDLTGCSGCYEDMFTGCANLVKAPALPATKLESYCYRNMFARCSSLTELPTLPATVMADACYSYMFEGCSDIKTVPANYLTSITSLAINCFYAMFSGCENLPSVVPLPSAPLAPYCYALMFDACRFKDVPNNYLPATTLATGCYYAMFAENPNLETTPDLPAEVMVDECYEGMFYKCPKVKAVKCLGVTGIKAPQATYLWLDSVSPGGTFTRKEGSDWHHSGFEGGIPDGWTEVVVP